MTTASAAETTAMRRAIAAARAVIGTTNPNPAVGAVLLDRAGLEVSVGATAPAGGPHAEVVALDAAGKRAHGGTLVVTLEPCAHRGRTAACTDAVLAAGVARVVYAVSDPHEVAAGGAEALSQSGVAVEAGLLADEALVDLAPWVSAMRRGRPHVTWKYAATLDGRTAASDGTSRWITGEQARADVHAWRARSDAVMVGVGTVLADDPSLTIRGLDVGRQALRVVVDSQARTPLGSKLLDGAADTLVGVSTDAPSDRCAALRDAGAEVVELPPVDGRVDLAALLAVLHERERYLLLVEGGATLAAGFMAYRLIDRVVGYVAPTLLGAGTAVLDAFGITTLDDAPRLLLREASAIGTDVRIVADVGGS
ncbi:MAG TPA: bifunctional diaminohydroxyphosphoribosylaminopyrimidine deaminase/5-amino-6-(5-phosphoribosylamino)uracil reductase RibD [Mycobacteriales bacterium]|nr:bifunctional diaminohydroxyphosphoribosylaminopyrimidine deaminase/5-amino-6-(5-phosphoribosylamino)uracil reductase RibD [Mycobacteriales bacterium]